MPILATVASMFSAFNVNEAKRSLTMPHYYTSVAFGRILSLARRQLRLSPTHFEAVLHAIIHDSGLVLAPNLKHEQVKCDISLLA